MIGTNELKVLQSQAYSYYSSLIKIIQGKEPIPYQYLLQYFWIFATLSGYLLLASRKKPLLEGLWYITRGTLFFIVLHVVWYYLDVHKRWGPWGISETKSHFRFTMETSWIVVLFTIGDLARMEFYGMDQGYSKSPLFFFPSSSPFPLTKPFPPIYLVFSLHRIVLWDLPEKYQILKCDSMFVNVFLGILGFYAIDFLRYWAHRLGHNKPLYKTFPFARKPYALVYPPPF